MSIFKYFSTEPRDLPNPMGTLSCELSSPAIAADNAAVNNLQQAMPRGVGAKKWGSHMKLDKEMKIKIGKCFSKNGVSPAARRFSAELGRDMNPSMIRGCEHISRNWTGKEEPRKTIWQSQVCLQKSMVPRPHPLLPGEGYVRGWRN